MNQPEFPPAVALSDVFDPETFRALALHIALGSIPDPEEPQGGDQEM